MDPAGAGDTGILWQAEIHLEGVSGEILSQAYAQLVEKLDENDKAKQGWPGVF